MKTPTPMTKSPTVAREAPALARGAMPAYSSPTSRRDFTQRQLSAVLALKTSLRTDYRGVAQHLRDYAEVRADLGLARVPHYSTPCHAAGRPLTGGPSPASSAGPSRSRPAAA